MFISDPSHERMPHGGRTGAMTTNVTYRDAAVEVAMHGHGPESCQELYIDVTSDAEYAV